MSHTDYNNPPPCAYCGEPLTSNEWDDEPGTTPGFFSAHFRCTQPSRDGRYAVRTSRNGTTEDALASKRFTTAARARAEADYLAGCNYRHGHGWTNLQFVVQDTASGETVAIYLARLVNPRTGLSRADRPAGAYQRA